MAARMEYDAFWGLNATVNQYKYAVVKLYNKLRGSAPALDYDPTVWEMKRLLYTLPEDPVLEAVAALPGILRFPKNGVGAFNAQLFGTYFKYNPGKNQRGGGDEGYKIVRNLAVGAASYAATRSFQLLNEIWNKYRWYLLELRHMAKHPATRDVDHDFVAPSASMLIGKLLRGGPTGVSPVRDDPVLKGLDVKNIDIFMNEIGDPAHQKIVLSNTSVRNARARTKTHTRSRSRRRSSRRTQKSPR